MAWRVDNSLLPDVSHMDNEEYAWMEEQVTVALNVNCWIPPKEWEVNPILLLQMRLVKDIPRSYSSHSNPGILALGLTSQLLFSVAEYPPHLHLCTSTLPMTTATTASQRCFLNVLSRLFLPLSSHSPFSAPGDLRSLFLSQRMRLFEMLL